MWRRRIITTARESGRLALAAYIRFVETEAAVAFRLREPWRESSKLMATGYYSRANSSRRRGWSWEDAAWSVSTIVLRDSRQFTHDPEP